MEVSKKTCRECGLEKEVRHFRPGAVCRKCESERGKREREEAARLNPEKHRTIAYRLGILRRPDAEAERERAVRREARRERLRREAEERRDPSKHPHLARRIMDDEINARERAAGLPLTKACRTCGVRRPLDEFPIKYGRGGSRAKDSKCLPCKRAYHSSYGKARRAKLPKKPPRPPKPPKPISPTTERIKRNRVANERERAEGLPLTKECATCGVRKPSSEFSKSARGGSGGGLGVHSRCKVCAAKNTRRWWRSLPPEVRKEKSRKSNAKQSQRKKEQDA